MAATYTRQHRPVSQRETSDEDGLSVAFARDTANNINNAKAYRLVNKIASNYWPTGFTSADTVTTTEEVALVCPPVYVADGYDKITWTMQHARTTGSGNVTWKLYCATRLYTGPSTLDTSFLGPAYTADTTGVTTSSGTWTISVQDEALGITRDSQGRVWLVLTATNTSGNQATIYALDAWPRVAAA